MLHIFTPPASLRSGNDVIGSRTALALTQAGLPAISHDLLPDLLASTFERGHIPFGRRIFRKVIAPPLVQRKLAAITNGDAFWILGSAVPMVEDSRLERQVIERGGRYIYHVMDDWLSTPYLRAGTMARCHLARLVVVPTPELFNRIRETTPEAHVVRLEEPIDIDRVFPMPAPDDGLPPLVVWCGNPGQLRRVDTVVDILNMLQKHRPFRFRVISGRRPNLSLDFAWEWKPYSYMNESHLLAGAVAGIAPLDDTPYTRCKGAYKIKTYMAAGIPAVASPVGYQRDLVKEGITGFLPDSDTAWLENLRQLITHSPLASSLGCASREIACRLYSHAAIAPAWMKAVASAC